MKWLVVVALAACHHDAGTCDDDLEGVYDDSGQRWMILDGTTQLEAYPLFADVPAVAGLEVAPRVMELSRAPGGITGTLHRRYMQHAAICDARTPVHVTACTAGAIELVVAEPAPPVGFAPCAWGRPNESQRRRWVRQ